MQNAKDGIKNSICLNTNGAAIQVDRQYSVIYFVGRYAHTRMSYNELSLMHKVFHSLNSILFNLYMLV